MRNDGENMTAKYNMAQNAMYGCPIAAANFNEKVDISHQRMEKYLKDICLHMQHHNWSIRAKETGEYKSKETEQNV